MDVPRRADSGFAPGSAGGMLAIPRRQGNITKAVSHPEFKLAWRGESCVSHNAQLIFYTTICVYIHDLLNSHRHHLVYNIKRTSKSTIQGVCVCVCMHIKMCIVHVCMICVGSCLLYTNSCCMCSCAQCTCIGCTATIFQLCHRVLTTKNQYLILVQF